MSEMQQRGGEQQSRLFIAMRSSDRRTLISPSNVAPDFFVYDNVDDSRLSLESRVHGVMRSHAHVNVNSDHALRMPAEEPESSAYAVYYSSTNDYASLARYGKFDVRDVRMMRHDLDVKAQNIADFPEMERRDFRIKSALFQQVINLFEGKSIGSLRRPS